MLNLKNKTVVLVIPSFFDYDKIIKDALLEKGARVYVVYDNLSSITLVAWLLKFNLFKLCYNYILLCLANKIMTIDYLLVIKGSCICPELLNYVRHRHNSAKFIMYQWDSVKNNESAYQISKYFDKKFTFDKEDSVKLGWLYRPLFYKKSYISSCKRKYKLAFIASLHSNRALILNKLKKISIQKKISMYYFLFASKLFFYWVKYVKKIPVYSKISNDDVSFTPLKQNKVLEIFNNSEILVDYSHPDQTGLTMRTIEAIGAKSKLLTNNKFIKNADFYNENNVCVYELENFDIPDSFLNSSYIEYNSELYHYYSIDGWIEDIFAE